MSDVHVEGAALDWIAFYFSAQVSNFVPLCFRSNWSPQKRKGRDWIADWIASQGHLSTEEIHNCSRSVAYGHCTFSLASQKQL